MICYDVELITIEDFKQMLATKDFDTILDLHDFIDLFLKHFKKSIRQQIKLEEKQIEELSRRKFNKQDQVEFDEFMECIDETVLERRIYMENIDLKNKYRGRYNYGNSKRKTCNGKAQGHIQLKAPIQLRCL
jgi:hypothetical protein